MVTIITVYTSHLLIDRLMSLRFSRVRNQVGDIQYSRRSPPPCNLKLPYNRSVSSLILRTYLVLQNTFITSCTMRSAPPHPRRFELRPNTSRLRSTKKCGLPLDARNTVTLSSDAHHLICTWALPRSRAYYTLQRRLRITRMVSTKCAHNSSNTISTRNESLCETSEGGICLRREESVSCTRVLLARNVASQSSLLDVMVRTYLTETIVCSLVNMRSTLLRSFRLPTFIKLVCDYMSL